MNKLQDILFCHENHYYTHHDDVADGNSHYRCVCLNPIIPVTNHEYLCGELCTSLENSLIYPSSEACKFLMRLYYDSNESEFLFI